MCVFVCLEFKVSSWKGMMVQGGIQPSHLFCSRESRDEQPALNQRATAHTRDTLLSVCETHLHIITSIHGVVHIRTCPQSIRFVYRTRFSKN